MDMSLSLFPDTDDEENEDFNMTGSISQVTPIQEVSLEDALPSEIQLEPVDSSTDQEVICEVSSGKIAWRLNFHLLLPCIVFLRFGNFLRSVALWDYFDPFGVGGVPQPARFHHQSVY